MLCPDVGEREVGGGPGQVLEGQVAPDNAEPRDVVEDDGSEPVFLDRIEGIGVDVHVLRPVRTARIVTVGGRIDADAFDCAPGELRLAFVVRASCADRLAKRPDGVRFWNKPHPVSRSARSAART